MNLKRNFYLIGSITRIEIPNGKNVRHRRYFTLKEIKTGKEFNILSSNGPIEFIKSIYKKRELAYIIAKDLRNIDSYHFKEVEFFASFVSPIHLFTGYIKDKIFEPNTGIYIEFENLNSDKTNQIFKVKNHLKDKLNRLSYKDKVEIKAINNSPLYDLNSKFTVIDFKLEMGGDLKWVIKM